jgi:N-acetylglucosaminyldiphosphoundecaprenol N-acetyl-beta-D-mannosaminyltransferase
MNMPKQQKAEILGCFVDLLDLEQAVETIRNLRECHDTQMVVTLNAEIAYAARDNRQLQAIINSAGLVTADGIGVVWAVRTMGGQIKQRVTGIELVYRVSEEAAREGWRIFLLGSAPGIAEKAADGLCSLYPGLKVAGSEHGYHGSKEMPAVISKINEARPDILMVALGAPRQEYWISEHQAELEVPVCIGVGGSFDVIAGEKKRAPEIFIKLNLEWLYRLLSEPARIKRQVVLPLFVFQVLKNKYMHRNKGDE